jgi:hypothetical protein
MFADNTPHRQILEIGKNSDFVHIAQTGYNEKLLCHDCEVRFSKHEGYTIKQLRKGLWDHAPCVPDNSPYHSTTRQVSGLNYQLFKLCFLSIFWRMSVSNGFGCPSFGMRHEKRLRTMLLNNDPGGDEIYPLSFNHWTLSGNDTLRLMRYLGRNRISPSVTGHTILCREFVITIWMSNEPIGEPLLSLCLRNNGSMICGDGDLQQIPWLMKDLKSACDQRMPWE